MAKRKQGISNNSLAALVLLAIVVSVAGTWVALTKGPSWLSLTGMQQANGTAQFNLTTYGSLRFDVASVDWGSGRVNTTNLNTECVLDTVSASINSTKCVDFSAVTQGLVLENNGNQNLSVTLNASKTVAAFIGGTSPSFKWNITNNETGSCGTIGVTWDDIYGDSSTADPQICDSMDFINEKDSLLINLKVSIPYDATAGNKTVKLVATGTAI